MFPEGLAAQQREFWIGGWAWRKTGARQVDWLLPSCPRTPVQGLGSLAPAQGGDFTWDAALHCGLLGLGTCWGETRHPANQLSFQQQDPAWHLMPLLINWKLFWTLKLLNKMFLNVPWKFSLLILVWFIAFKKNGTHSQLDYALYTN